VTLQTNGKTIKQHVKKRASAALGAIQGIKNLRLHSLETAIKLFTIKVTQILANRLGLPGGKLLKDS
jgi:hypothetical protein